MKQVIKSAGPAIAVLIVAGSVVTTSAGCSNKASTPPLTQESQSDMYKHIQQDAKNYGAYRQAHPINAPAGGGQSTGQ